MIWERAAILRITMRGDDLLLAHMAQLSYPQEDDEQRPSARERLEAELGPELADALVTALVKR